MSRRVKVILNPMADMGNAWKVADDLRPIHQRIWQRRLERYGVSNPCNGTRQAGW